VLASPVRQSRFDQSRLAERVDLADNFALQPGRQTEMRSRGYEGAKRAASGVSRALWTTDSHGDWNRAVAPGISGIFPVVTLKPNVALGNGDVLRTPPSKDNYSARGTTRV
jgi:hypothetical protein